MELPFKALVEQISDFAIAVIDTDGVIRSWNAGARAITGYTEREALGRRLDSLIDESVLKKAAKSGSASLQCWLARKSGGPLWTQNNVQVMKSEHGAQSLCWVCHDPFHI
jgi:PAS domain S-box-containing protein